MITIVDYGLGNVKAFANIYRQLNIPVSIADGAEALAGARKIILPGVGAFDWAMARLQASGMRDALDRAVLEDKADVLGVCVGMQMMARRSEEGSEAGLGWIDAEVVKLDTARLNGQTRLPHMGWNDIGLHRPSPLFDGLEGSRFYFLHSFHMIPADDGAILARADYGVTVAAAIGAGNIYATQFHPEKSHAGGIRLLKNFAAL